MTRRLFFNYLPFLFLIASFFTSCNRSHEKKSGSKDNTLVVKLVATSIEVAQSYVADVQAVQFVEVKPKVEGFVEDVLVDEGEHVKKGQVLFKLSSAELYEEVKEAQANYKQVQAELKMAEVEADRVKRLVEKDIISPIRLEQALAEADVARLRVQQAKSRLLRAETNYSYTTITSPFGVEQPEYNNLELILSDQTTYPYKGTVETVEGDFERGTGSIAFRARFANPDRLLRHGVSGKIRMLTEMEDVILVPQRSTFEIQDFTYVYTVDEEGKVSVRSFEPLSRHGAYYVTKDLPDNTLIVYEGVQQVSDGMVITPEIVDAETVRKQLELSDEVENNK